MKLKGGRQSDLYFTDFGLLGCAGKPKLTVPAPSARLLLDEAIQQAAERMEARVAAETRIAPVNVSLPSAQFSELVLVFKRGGWKLALCGSQFYRRQSAI
jgi:hypothetical protein